MRSDESHRSESTFRGMPGGFLDSGPPGYPNIGNHVLRGFNEIHRQCNAPRKSKSIGLHDIVLFQM